MSGAGSGVVGGCGTGTNPSWELQLHLDPLKIARLGPQAPVPNWAQAPGPLYSVTRNHNETSLICPAHAVPREVTQAGPFHAFELKGPLDFTLTAVLSGLLAPLAAEQISIFTVSTFDTDWILVPTHQTKAAIEVWRRNGHLVMVADELNREGE